MNYKIKIYDYLTTDTDYIRMKIKTFKDAEDFLKISDFELIDDLCRVWENRGLTARVVKEVKE